MEELDTTKAYVGLVHPIPEVVTWKTVYKVKVICPKKDQPMVVGLSLLVWTPHIRVFQRVWRCYGDTRIHRVRLHLDDDVAFRQSIFNNKSVTVSDAKVRNRKCFYCQNSGLGRTVRSIILIESRILCKFWC